VWESVGKVSRQFVDYSSISQHDIIDFSTLEGRHAANAADFAIAQFRFIVPLLMEHGRFNYIRCSKLVLYSFFKNLMLVSVLFYYCAYSGFSGTIPLNSIVFSGYNFYLGIKILFEEEFLRTVLTFCYLSSFH
jgi:magnesium-transporting ATPase (P-type)